MSEKRDDGIIVENGWDDLNNVHKECEALFVTPAKVMPLLKSAQAIENSKDPKRIVEEAKIMEKDIKAFSERLKEIKKKHEGKEGHLVTEDDMMFCLSVGEEYQQWMASYQQVVLPIVFSMIENFENKPESDTEDTSEGSEKE